MANRLRRVREVLAPATIPGLMAARVPAGTARRTSLAPNTAAVGWQGARYARTPSGLDPFTFPPGYGVWSREAAVSIPTISRARDLICSLVGSLPLVRWTAPTDPDLDPVRLSDLTWQRRPDPARTRSWILAWTADDLMFEGRAYWRTTARYEATGFPAAFELMRAADVTIDAQGQARWLGAELAEADVIQFLSPTDGLLTAGARAMSIALELDLSAERYAKLQTPAGWLQEQPGGEPSDAAYLASMASAFASAREANTIAALNSLFAYHESSMDPNKLQLTEGRTQQALELARVANVPPYLVGAPAGTGMTYQNAQQARSDLVDFGAMPFITCIEQTLSGPNVTPTTQAIRLDLDAWLRSPLAPGDEQAPASSADAAAAGGDDQ